MRLNLLGSFEAVAEDGAVIRFQRKEAAWLAYLAAPRIGARTRAELCDLFWENRPSAEAQHNLRQLLYHVRAGLQNAGEPAAILVPGRLDVALDPEHVATDLEEFERLAQSRDIAGLESAAQLYHSPFLHGLDLGCNGFEEWLRLIRVRLGERMLDVLRRLEQMYAGQDRSGALVRVLMRQIELDPGDRAARDRLDRAFRASGRRGPWLAQHPDARAPTPDFRHGSVTAILAPLSIGGGSAALAANASAYWWAARESLRDRKQLVLHAAPVLSQMLAGSRGQDIDADILIELKAFEIAGAAWVETTVHATDGLRSGWHDVRRVESRTAAESGQQMAGELAEEIVARRGACPAPMLGPPIRPRLLNDSTAVAALFSFSASGIRSAIDRLDARLARRPADTEARAWRAYARLQDAWYGPVGARDGRVEAAAADALETLRGDTRSTLARIVLGRALVLLGLSAEGRSELANALLVAPRSALANFALGQAKVYVGDFAAGGELMRRALDLSPAHPHRWTFEHVLAWALMELGEREEAARIAKRAAGRANATHFAALTLVASSASDADRRVWRRSIAKLRASRPHYGLHEAAGDIGSFVHPEVRASYLRRLERAGLD